jgi:hypothetical protein
VVVAAHTVGGRWEIPEQVLKVHAISDVEARIQAARQVHIVAGVAPWRPWLRQTYARCRA